MLAVRINNRLIRLEPMHPDLAMIKRRRRAADVVGYLISGLSILSLVLGVTALGLIYIN